jgi:hypothetical protein
MEVFEQLFMLEEPLELSPHILHDLSSLDFIIALILHDHNKLFSINFTVFICVSCRDHLMNLLVGVSLTQMSHDECELVVLDLAAAILI